MSHAGVVALVAGVLLVWVTPTAQAEVTPVTDGLLLSAVNYADEWWTDRGSPPPCAGASPVLWEDLTDIGAPDGYRTESAATRYGCATFWDRHYWRDVRHTMAHGSWHWKLKALVVLCVHAIHERGHNLGYGHEAGGVMEYGGGIDVAPGGCYDWALPIRARLRRVAVP